MATTIINLANKHTETNATNDIALQGQQRITSER